MKIRTKNTLNFLDVRFFNGKLRRLCNRIKESRKKTFFNGKKSVIIEVPVQDLVLMQSVQQEYNQYQFYDLGVRYLAIENYYGLNTDGFELYRKMHTNGGNYGQKNDTEAYYKRMKNKNRTAKYGLIPEQHSIEQFSKLIESYDRSGYDPNSTIMCDKHLLNMNGSHRLTLAIYRGQEFINVDVHNEEFRRRFNIDWFWQNGFTNDEINRIRNVTNCLIANAHDKVGDYFCLLYPGAHKHFESITRDIGCICPDNIQVKEFHDVKMYVNDFVGFIKCVYSFDSINEENLKRKIDFILEASNLVDDTVIVRIVRISIKNPMYRVKDDNGMPESVATVRLKENIRSKYKLLDTNLNIHKEDIYNHDVIIHSTDNYLSNKAFEIMSSMDKDISGLFSELRAYQYVVVESGIDKVHPRFPFDFYLNDDIDIFVYDEEIDSIIDITYQFCCQKFNHPWYKVDVIQTDNGKRVRVVLKESLIIMFDYMCKMKYLKKTFIADCINERLYKNGVYYISDRNEVWVRFAKYCENKQKIWHLIFVRSYKRRNLLKFENGIFNNNERLKKIYEDI